MDVCFLSSPLDIVRCLHNAFRRDIFQIDDAAFKIARGGGDLTAVFDRLHVIGEVLDYHARGEEAAVFPAVDNVAPLVAKAYLMDHRELDIMVSGLEAMRKAPDPLAAARATAALNAHLADPSRQGRCPSVRDSQRANNRERAGHHCWV